MSLLSWLNIVMLGVDGGSILFEASVLGGQVLKCGSMEGCELALFHKFVMRYIGGCDKIDR